ncbi:cupin domain-containing protein [Nocardia sp. NPDC050175]|uniref:cupin domain-containing protein n=1 Tax=Nocardia sp. NPDC050175 TaxID=3364317 RepID=UPI0037A48FE4
MTDYEPIRRVVTGHDSTGKAIVIDDEQVPSVSPPEFGGRWAIWSADAPVTLPNDGTAPKVSDAQFPPSTGVKIIKMALPPKYNPDALSDKTELFDPDLLAALGFLVDPNPPGSYGTRPGITGMHASATVDCVLQLSGETVFILEDNEIHLKPGDWLVINGVVHAWRNDRDEPAVLMGVMVGAEHSGIPKR